MHISIDGGALCASDGLQFGNATFTRNFLEAVCTYDNTNEYTVYSFCDKPASLILNERVAWKTLTPSTFWMKGRVSFEEMITRKDYFLGLNQSLPLLTRAKILSFSHGLSFYFFPGLYKESHDQLWSQTQSMVRQSKHIFVSSSRVRDEFKDVFPDYRHIQVLPFGVPMDMTGPGKRKPKHYFLFVGMDAPIKNIEYLVRAMEDLVKDSKYRDFKLYLAGNFVQENFDPKLVTCIPTPTRKKLRELYLSATAYLSGSWYESFNFPALEAASLGCPVIATESATIPEMKTFVNCAKDKTEFTNLMREAIECNLKLPSPKTISNAFSWKNYVHTLTKFYD